MLKIGDRFPDFSLTASNGQTVTASSLRGKRYVMFFYPKDNTPGCTTEACAFRDNIKAFEKLGVPVFGISADPDAAHQKFVRKYSLNFPLLADPEKSLLTACGTWIEKSMYGRRYMGVTRSTFVVGPDAKIQTVWEKVSPANHASEVLDFLRGAKPGDRASDPRRAGGRVAAARKQPAAKAAKKTVTASSPRAATKPTASKASTRNKAMKKSAVRKAPGKSAGRKAAPSKTAARKSAATASARKRR